MLSLCLVVAVMVLGSDSCPLPDPRAGTALDYSSVKGFVVTEGEDRFVRFAPIFLVEDYEDPINRIGTPAARLDEKGNEDVYVDPSHPTYYTQVQQWKTDHGTYTNLIYRVHFAMSKSNSKSVDGGKGYNVGLMAVVTLDEQDRPLLINAVHTCGCFHAILPTTFLPESEYPEDWNIKKYTTYGETVPGLVRYPQEFGSDVRPVLFLRSGSHRVVDVQVASIDSVHQRYALAQSPLAPVEDLEHLKLGSGETSFFFTEGKNRGLVKGAIKTKETLLLGAVIGDSRVGQDRMFGGEDAVPRGFYTTINPTKKDASDVWDYAGFLKANGWKL
ncbi:MAG: hypothetical protein HYZ00_11840 [Candidatus Hydrogenedentes bacterium]|nr:hypothetical protein [Candidatus Hydrogenedentota bacterium]